MDIGVSIASLGIYVCLFFALYFEVFLLISFIEKRPTSKDATLPKRYPTVSVIVPCYNEERTIAATLNSLLALKYPKEKLGVIVVDDGSRDGTKAVAQKFAKSHPQIQYFYKKNGGKYTALNFGIEHTTSELIGCLDADSFVAPDALMEVVKKFEQDPTTMALTPAMQVHKPRKLLELMQAVEYTFGIFYKKMFDNLSAISVLPGPFSIYKREVFDTIGLFRHAHNTEDMEIAFRMQANHLKISNAHNAYVYTTVPSTVRALVRQRTRWSQGFLQNSRDYAHMYFNRAYGNFGMLILPVGLIGFAAGLYTAAYSVYHILSFLADKLNAYTSTGIPFHTPSITVNLFYVNTSMMLFVIIATLVMTLTAIFLGGRIAQTRLSFKSFVSYFLFYGFIAPLWLARAAWGAALARESKWR